MIFGLLMASATGWAIGIEQEAAPGEYMTLLYQSFGWTVWYRETALGNSCDVGVGSNRTPLRPIKGRLFGGEPGVRWSEQSGRWVVSGFGFKPEIKYRLKGERFYKNVEQYSFADVPEGAKVDIVYKGWEHPSFIGLIEKSGTVDFTGKTAAMVAYRRCLARLK